MTWKNMVQSPHFTSEKINKIVLPKSHNQGHPGPQHCARTLLTSELSPPGTCARGQNVKHSGPGTSCTNTDFTRLPTFSVYRDRYQFHIFTYQPPVFKQNPTSKTTHLRCPLHPESFSSLLLCVCEEPQNPRVLMSNENLKHEMSIKFQVSSTHKY